MENFNKAIGAGPGLSYEQNVADQIVKHRRHLDNELFFDRLMRAIGLSQVHELYPPRSNSDLRRLYDLIAGSESPDHHQQSLVYYILKDLRPKAQSPAQFAAQTYIPSKYQTFIDGIWSLDRLDLETAVSYLAEPSLVPTFPEEILYTLCKHSKQNPQIALAYFHTVSPPIITSGKTLDALFDATAQASLTEAYFFSRTHDCRTQRHLFERLLSFVHGSSGGQLRAIRASELIGLPLERDEEQWLEEYLTEGKGRGLYGAQDTVIMRRIVMGRTREASELSHGTKDLKDRKIDGVNWTSLTESLRQSAQ